MITTKIGTTLIHHLLTNAQVLYPYLQIDVTLVVVVECVGIEEGFL